MPFLKRRSISKIRYSGGFTLIEIIIAIVTMSIALAVISNIILPAASQSAGQVQQIRASELGQSFMNEIIGKAFDENSDMSGSVYRCNETGQLPCTRFSDFTGANDGELRVNYDDVDDYHNYDEEGDDITNAKGDSLGDLYLGFRVQINVVYDGNYDGVPDNNQLAKLITVTVTTNTRDEIVFSSYKANF